MEIVSDHVHLFLEFHQLISKNLKESKSRASIAQTKASKAKETR